MHAELAVQGKPSAMRAPLGTGRLSTKGFQKGFNTGAFITKTAGVGCIIDFFKNDNGAGSCESLRTGGLLSNETRCSERPQPIKEETGLMRAKQVKSDV